MSTDTSTSLRISRVVRADRETVFRAWTEADRLKQWAAPEGFSVVATEVDLTVGGRYRIQMQSPDGEHHTAAGTYRAIERPLRLCYTWQWEEGGYDVGETLVTVEFNDLGGSTEIVLTHELFPTNDAKEAHEQGWASCLNRIEAMFI
jgi:uncharacterized protein YndB with AHSA1/START domain